ncbi:branched-chain amino acid ABC transporter permease [Pseudonocardia sp. HH130630-07]|uniref:branched-chain amino acid ABC transporter permease n=1 Tax=Pseudonocardia sp. HH130630-07 TaxID=1690815 RepID=UPI0008150A8B|nr:branched-chain amino acid ABC transporter permease [Pseudonocardia sp. HH130630-07]ANY08511.1 hypothetical protein AFB00_22070 [Pseudonocardia sp. HH130630-07]
MSGAVQVLVDGLVIGGFYALMAQGLSLVFGVMRVINLAHGEMVLVGAYLAWSAHTWLGLDPLLALPLVMVAGYGAGLLLARVTVLRVVERPRLMALLLTFGLAFVLQGLMVRLFTTTPKLTPSVFSDGVVEVLGLRVVTPRLVMLGAALVVMVAVVALLRHTRTGKAMRAAAQNTEAARIVGIDIDRTYARAFAFGTALALGAGVLFSATQNFTPAMGPLFTLKAFVIIVLGGAGRVGGTVAAALVIGIVEATLASYVPGIGTGLGVAASFVLVVLVLAVRSDGLNRSSAQARA